MKTCHQWIETEHCAQVSDRHPRRVGRIGLQNLANDLPASTISHRYRHGHDWRPTKCCLLALPLTRLNSFVMYCVILDVDMLLPMEPSCPD